MSSTQTPLGTPFNRDSTADEVLADIDFSGKLAVVTGGYSGLGLETTAALVRAGARVVVPARRPEHAKQVLVDALGESAAVEVAALDLADFDSIKQFAAEFLNSRRGIDVLINNAAIMACAETRLYDGWEAQFATNHLGHYLLTNLLYPALQADGGARVVSLSSVGHKLSPVRWNDVMFMDGYDKWLAYGQAKTANSLFAVELDRLGKADNVRAFAVHPGGIMTPLQRHLQQEEMIAFGWIDKEGNVSEQFKSPEQGASTSVWAASSPQLADHGGVYCEDCDVAAPTDEGSPTSRYHGINAHAIDRGDAQRLWTYSAKLTGCDAFS